MSDNEVALLREHSPGMTDECVEKARFGGFAAISSLAVDQCFEMDTAQTYRGLWRDDFEGSRFCPSPQTECTQETSGEAIWLTFSPELEGRENVARGMSGNLYAIEFIGRMTAHRGHYGHMGMFNREAVVDEITSIRPLTPGQKSR
ncbi:hypothetical protein [Croceicoccus sp. Ery5]|uniref:hypothetical protein n=1 Tax=Croceicoccus sp. Ery5 TaxID=1703340 RepID=UPI001E4963F4|nr:hypothetical protein [Croceicoccus sp. Ery5]